MDEHTVLEHLGNLGVILLAVLLSTSVHYLFLKPLNRGARLALKFPQIRLGYGEFKTEGLAGVDQRKPRYHAIRRLNAFLKHRQRPHPEPTVAVFGSVHHQRLAGF